MRRFLKWFRPIYQLHGHIHLYDRSKGFQTRFLDTEVINVYPYRRLDLTFDESRVTAKTLGNQNSNSAVGDRVAPDLTELETKRHW